MTKRSASDMENADVTGSTDTSAKSPMPTPPSTTTTESTEANTKGPVTKKRSRSRLGCHRCKRLKVKCDETKPSCTLCVKANKPCDYSLKLTWGGRPFKDEKKSNLGFGTITSFGMKYNSEKSKASKQAEVKNTIQVKEVINFQIVPPLQPLTIANTNISNIPTSSASTSSVNLNLSVSAAISSLNDAPLSEADFDNFSSINNEPPLIQNQAKFEEVLEPLDTDFLESSESPNNKTSLHRSTGLKQFDDFASAFKDLDASNKIAKHFVTDFLLPGFSDENQLVLNTKPSRSHGVDSNSEDSNTPPGNQLAMNSSFHSYNTSTSPRIRLDSAALSPSKQAPYKQELHHQIQYTTATNDTNSFSSSALTSFAHQDTDSLQSLTIPEFQEYENLFNYNIDNFITLPQEIPFLPDLLLKNPRYREYYHHYIHTFSKILVPANASSYIDNPFTCLLPRLAMSSNDDGLLGALIAMCISQRYSRADADQSTFPKDLISDLLSRCLTDLYNRLTDPKESQSDYTIGLILVMTCFDIIRGSSYKWRAHYLGARKIVMSRGFVKAVSDQKNSASRKAKVSDNNEEASVSFDRGEESNLVFFFARWFAYLDTFALLVSSSDIYSSSPSRNLIKWSGPKVTRAERESLQDIDKLMGFDFKLLDFFAEIIALIDEREKNCKTANNLTIELIQRALAVKERLLEYIATTDKERDDIEIFIKFNPTDPRYLKLFDYARLRATNNVFALAGVLQIYRRVLMMATESDIVQNVVNQITEIIQDKIPDNTTAANCTMFSLFTAGCEAVDFETRAFYVQRLTKLIQNGATGARDAYNIMLDSWETRKFWADILSEKKIDIMFS